MMPRTSSRSVLLYFSIVLSLIIPSFLSAQTIYTFAGGKPGNGRPALESAIGEVRIVKSDTLDNVFIYEWHTQTIRRMDAASTIMKTIAGGGMLTYVDTVSALDYDLSSITDFTIDKSGVIYIAELNSIRKLDTVTGKLTLLAGKSFGYSGDDGPAIDAGFDHVSSIATDMVGNIIITDNNRIRKIDILTGIITRISGSGSVGFSGNNGLAINAELGQPKFLAIDTANNIYVGDQGGSMIRKINGTTGIITAFAGTGLAGYSGDGGQAKLAKIELTGLVIDTSLDVYISDNSRVRKIDHLSSIITTVAGTGEYTGPANDDGPATAAILSGIRAIGISPKSAIYISDMGHSSIRRFDLLTDQIKRHIGNGLIGVAGIGGPASDAQLLNTGTFTIDRKNNVYVADEGNARILRIDGATKILTVYAGTGMPGGANEGDGGPATLANIGAPSRMTTDTAGNLYFDENHQYIRKIDVHTGILTTIAGNGSYLSSGDNGPAIAAGFASIGGLVIDSLNNIYISDQWAHKIRKIDNSGMITTIAGTGTSSFSGDGGPALNATFFFPAALAFDKIGNLFIADFTNFRIRKIDLATGIVSTVAGSGAQGYSGDNGPALSAGLTYTTGLAVDKFDNIFISDNLSNRVRKINGTTGTITTYAGTGTPGYNGDSIPAVDALLNSPADLAIDSSGLLYIGDYENRRIRMIQPVSDSIKPIIKGVVFYDTNLNGTKDAGEQLADDVIIDATKPGLNIRVLTQQGQFEMKADTGSFVTTVPDQPYYNVVPASITSQFVTGALTDSISFALQPIAGKKDVTVNLRSLSSVRQAGNVVYDIEYENIGTAEAVNAKLSFVKSFKTTIDSTSPVRNATAGDTLIWNLGNLAAHTKGRIRVYSKVGIPPFVELNDSLFTSAMISHSVADLTPRNDTFRLKQRVTGAYDPNDKKESHAGYITPQQLSDGEYLHYLVRFQNTGNDTAINVEVRDSLDINLDASTVQTVSTSHRYQLSIVDGNKLSWKFDSILLPDSNVTKTGSIGYLAFKVKPKSGLAVGQQITNRSSIYFDYNAPVHTNQTITEVMTLPTPAVQPQLNTNAIQYCVNASEQKLKLTNKDMHYTASAYLNDSLLTISSDSSFAIKPSLLPVGTHNLRVHYINATGENTYTTTVKVNAALTPETDLLTDKSTLSNETEVFVLTAVNKKNGGSVPLYTFSRDRNFSSILKAESTSATASLTASTLAAGENWLYVRMKTSEACFTSATVIDSVKVTKTVATGIVDIDNPSVTISAYPNPVDKGFTITGLNTAKTYVILVRDNKGALKSSYSIASKSSFYIAAETWQKGIFWITIIDVKKSRTLGTTGVIKQ